MQLSDLVVIIGPPASGKAAAGLALSQLTGFCFFHNHMTAEPAAALFGWGTEAYGEAAEGTAAVSNLVEMFESKGRNVFFVELAATFQA